jgi:hypothetical protein
MSGALLYHPVEQSSAIPSLAPAKGLPMQQKTEKQPLPHLSSELVSFDGKLFPKFTFSINLQRVPSLVLKL